MAEIKSLLDDVIEREIQNLGSLSSGSEEKSSAVKDLAALHKLRIEEIKAQIEADEKRERRQMDSEQRRAELALKEKQVEVQNAQQQTELSLKARQIDGSDADRHMKNEQFKAEITLKEKQLDGAAAERELKERQMQVQAKQQEAEFALKEREADGRDTDRAREDAFQKQQAYEQMLDRCVRTGVAAAELVLPLIFYGVWMKRGFRFEETGSFTSTTFKNLINRFRPTK